MAETHVPFSDFLTIEKLLAALNTIGVGLLSLFALPAFRYLSLKWMVRRHGNPELWYVPKYGFRLVIRNLPGEKNLSDIKYRALLRRTVPATSGISVATFSDTVLLERSDFFLFGGTDQVLIAFQLKRRNVGKDGVYFVWTDKLGEAESETGLSDFDTLICDYVATVKNYFNFDIKVERRVEIDSSSFREFWKLIQLDHSEREFELDLIRDPSTSTLGWRILRWYQDGEFARSTVSLRTILKEWLAILLATALLSVNWLALDKFEKLGLQLKNLGIVVGIHHWAVMILILAAGLQPFFRLLITGLLIGRIAGYILYPVILFLVIADAFVMMDVIPLLAVRIVSYTLVLGVWMALVYSAYSIGERRRRPRSAFERHLKGESMSGPHWKGESVSGPGWKGESISGQ